ncbi:alpha/beta fold hydrolase [Yimella sp. cx-51]|uniref:alpha/beta fold hydrolase n=1 Tax=Yimella sp. cx-51 TaxID=2770551 RepID=UPI0016837151|nr:alpha/beta hydrolase [Yimella sp. cx-51]MBD2758821.1 alpha/beta hydrolase [Yimella sp. cx-573]
MAFPVAHRRIRGGLTRRREIVGVVRTGWVERSVRRPERPLVLIPGLSMSWHAYQWFLEQHPDNRPILVIDPPGCGRSTRLPGAMDADAQGAHIAAWLSEQQLGPVDLVGHSLGAVTGARLSAQHPELVASLTMVSPSPDARWPRMRQHVSALVRGVPAEAPRVIAQAAFDYVRANPLVLADFGRQAGRPADEVMDGVRTPVLVVRGTADLVSSHKWCADLADAAGGELLAVPDGAHGLPQQMPAELVRIVTEFTQTP